MQEKESFYLLFILSCHNSLAQKRAFVHRVSTTSTCSATSARVGGGGNYSFFYFFTITSLTPFPSATTLMSWLRLAMRGLTLTLIGAVAIDTLEGSLASLLILYRFMYSLPFSFTDSPIRRYLLLPTTNDKLIINTSFCYANLQKKRIISKK